MKNLTWLTGCMDVVMVKCDLHHDYRQMEKLAKVEIVRICGSFSRKSPNKIVSL